MIKIGLRTRLALLLATFGVLATGLTGLYAYRQARVLLVQAAQRDLLGSTQMFRQRLAAVIGRIGADATMLAQLEVTRDLASGPIEAEQARRAADNFAQLLRANPRYAQIRLIGVEDHGLERVRVDRDQGMPLRVEADRLQEKGHEPYVFEAIELREGDVFLDKIDIDHELGTHAAFNKPVLQVASPVAAADGKARAVIVISVDVTRVFRDLEADIPSHLKLLLANEWGDFLIHPDSSQAFAFEQGRRALIQDAFPEVVPVLDGRSPSVFAEAELNIGGQNSPVVASFTRMTPATNSHGDALLLGFAEPLPEILRSTHLLARTIGALVLAVSAAAIVLALLAARVVTRPLNQMTRQVQRFSRHREVGPLPTSRHDEIGELARGFEQMQHNVLTSMGELQASREHLADRARRDPLTGLRNRAGFIEHLEHALAAARQSRHCMALLFVDLDRFKLVNDSYGHAVGDHALEQVAQRLKASVREADLVGRLGGDEFVILLESLVDERDASRVAQNLIERFREPIVVSGIALEIGVSIGISVFPRDGEDVSSLMERADAAMYRSKGDAGNRYSVFGDL